jgi:pimeloyl-ACP methyl ester carboxylesterase
VIDPVTPDDLLEWQVTTVDGRPAAYGVAGRGPTVVFVHGWAVTNRTYKAALKRIVRRGCRVFAPALPGFGGTAPLPAPPDDIALYAAWLVAFLDAVGCTEPVVLVGHSFGGGVAIAAAHACPDRVRALVLLNSIGGSAWRTDDGLRTVRQRPLWDWGIHFSRDVLPLRQVRRVLPVILRDVLENVARNPFSVWHAANVARDADLTAELEVLRERRLPVVVLWGEQDRIVSRASVDSIIDALGEPTTVRVAGSHSWLLADPDEFGEVMTNVLDLAGGPLDETDETDGLSRD